MSDHLIYSFRVGDAEKYGVECAVILYNFRFWLDKNKANKQHEYEGRYWTYNSASALAELFPFLSESQVYRRVKKLEKEGAILTGQFSQKGYDRTTWYSVNEEDYKAKIKQSDDSTATCNSETSISRNSKIHSTKSQDPFYETVRPITDTKPDTKPNTNSQKKKNKRKESAQKELLEQETIQSAKKIPAPVEDVEEYMKYIYKKRQGCDPPPDHAKVIFNEAHKFWNYYESNGWKVGRNKMKNWQSAVVNWLSRVGEYSKKTKPQSKNEISDEEIDSIIGN